jgi:hypothetical protein
MLDFANDALHRSASLPTACKGDNAKRAELVAAAHDGNPRTDSFGTNGENVIVVFHPREADSNSSLPVDRALDELGKTTILVGPNNEINVTLGLHKVSTQSLGHASEDSNDHPGIFLLVAPEVSQSAKNPLFGIFTNGARIDKDDIG